MGAHLLYSRERFLRTGTVTSRRGRQPAVRTTAHSGPLVASATPQIPTKSTSAICGCNLPNCSRKTKIAMRVAITANMKMCNNAKLLAGMCVYVFHSQIYSYL